MFADGALFSTQVTESLEKVLMALAVSEGCEQTKPDLQIGK